MVTSSDASLDVKKAHQSELFLLDFWSEYKDSNLGPPGPKPGALPDCATLRLIAYSSSVLGFPKAGSTLSNSQSGRALLQLHVLIRGCLGVDATVRRRDPSSFFSRLGHALHQVWKNDSSASLGSQSPFLASNSAAVTGLPW